MSNSEELFYTVLRLHDANKKEEEKARQEATERETELNGGDGKTATLAMEPGSAVLPVEPVDEEDGVKKVIVFPDSP